MKKTSDYFACCSEDFFYQNPDWKGWKRKHPWLAFLGDVDDMTLPSELDDVVKNSAHTIICGLVHRCMVLLLIVSLLFVAVSWLKVIPYVWAELMMPACYIAIIGSMILHFGNVAADYVFPGKARKSRCEYVRDYYENYLAEYYDAYNYEQQDDSEVQISR
ncbi:MAG: hypothetical protein LBT46_11125 [Planctomycetaceae bacterium]|nr:hypothetical protein [Planctomycetaceae bacterium]